MDYKYQTSPNMSRRNTVARSRGRLSRNFHRNSFARQDTGRSNRSRRHTKHRDSILLKQESFNSSQGSMGESEVQQAEELILTKTLLRKPANLTVFPKNKKNLKKWPNIKSSISMFNSFQYDRRQVLASGFGYEVIRGINKLNG